MKEKEDLMNNMSSNNDSQNTNISETSTDNTSAKQENNELNTLKDELEKQKNKYLRLFAEFDNYRKRNAKERLELIQTAGRDIIQSLLDVLDDTDRAEKQLQQTEDIKMIKEGVQLIFNKLRSTLQARGLRPMESMHHDFDVEKHEAITEIPVPTDELKGKVIEELQKGYYLNDKLIRFSKVVIGK